MQNYHRSLLLWCCMFYFTLFIEDVLQNSWRTTALINSAPWIHFSGCTKESPHGPERYILSNTIFCKNLPQLINFNAANLSLPLFLGVSLGCALNSHSCQKCNLRKVQKCKVKHQSTPETTLGTRYFMLFLKNLTKNLEEKLVIKFFWWNRSVYKYYIFLHTVTAKNSPAMHG